MSGPPKEACTEIPAASTQETSHNRDGCLSIARVAHSFYSSRFFLIDGLPQNVQRQAAPKQRHIPGREIHFLFSAHIVGEVAREHAAVHLVVLLGSARYSGYFLPTGHTFRHGIVGEHLGFIQEVLLKARQVTAPPACKGSARRHDARVRLHSLEWVLQEGAVVTKGVRIVS